MNSWKTLAWPMFSMNFHEKQWKTLAWPMFSMNLWFSKESPGTSRESMKFNEFMENIGLANVFHEFLDFPGFLADPRRFSGKPQIHGKHWPGQCLPLFFHGNSWKTLAWPMCSMNLWFSTIFHGTSQESTKFIEFMENIGLANVFHELVVFQRISWDQPGIEPGIYEIQ